MLDIVVKLVELIFGTGLDSIGTIKRLKGDPKKKVFWSLINIYDALEKLRENVLTLIEYTDIFIEWKTKGAEMSLEHEAARVREVFYSSYQIIGILLRDLDKNKKGVFRYLEVRDPKSYIKLSLLVKGKLKSFASMLDSASEEYRKHGLEFGREYSYGKKMVISTATFESSNYQLEARGDITIKYINLFDFISNDDASWEAVQRVKINMVSCSINNQDDLRKFRSYLLAMNKLYQSLRKKIRIIMIENFTIEDMF